MSGSARPAAAVPDVTPDPPSRAWRAVLALLGRLPQAALSRGLGRLADTPLPPFARTAVLSAFARAFGIDVSEAEGTFAEYRSVNAFFVRRLRPGARPQAEAPGMTSPVDGVVGQVGRITSGRLIQAKGRSYAATDLLGDDGEADRFEGGWFVTIYLSPRHYHRIHAPVDGAIPLARYVPGALFPVNDPAVRHVEDLFARNERLLAHIDGSHGRVSVVAVGAYNVGRISAAFDPAWGGGEGARGGGSSGGSEGGGGRDGRGPVAPTWITNRTDPLPRERRYATPVPVRRGEEIMAFHLGSTIVLLTEPATLLLEPRCAPGAEVRVGELLAQPA